MSTPIRKHTSTAHAFTMSDLNFRIGEGLTDTISLGDAEVSKQAHRSGNASVRNLGELQSGTSIVSGVSGTQKGYRQGAFGSITEDVMDHEEGDGWRFGAAYTYSHIIKDLYQGTSGYSGLKLYFKPVTNTTDFPSVTYGSSYPHTWSYFRMRHAGSSTLLKHTKSTASWNSYADSWIWLGGYDSTYGYGVGQTSGERVYIHLV